MPNTINILCVDPARAFAPQIAGILSGHDDFIWAEPASKVEDGLSINGDPPDVILCEADLPGCLELIEKTQAFNRKNPDTADVGVLLIARRSRKNAEETIQALEAGAFDFIIRQELPDEKAVMDSLARQLAVKLRHFSSKRIFSSLTAASARKAREAAPEAETKTPETLKALVIGVSTGGPKVLAGLLPRLTRITELPVFIVQHMPLGFTSSLASSLDAKCTHKVVEAADSMPVQQRTVYIAPGGKHMLIKKSAAGEQFIALTDDPPEEGCRPSVNVLFRSAATVYGAHTAAIILTGMGADGSKGLRELKAAGAFSIAQDEASSVVWGMPGSAVAAGLIDKVLPPGDIPERIMSLAKGARS